MTELAETELISPLLDGFAMGNPMSSHDGVRCCPAIKENSDEKYIVKIISVPAAQTQMDAMLLAGAYKDMAGAMDYFKGVADDVEKEAEFLQKLSKLEGFLPYDGWQTVPIKRRRLGYEVYLVSPTSIRWQSTSAAIRSPIWKRSILVLTCAPRSPSAVRRDACMWT